jgi:hypothetical protein
MINMLSAKMQNGFSHNLHIGAACGGVSCQTHDAPDLIARHKALKAIAE